MPIEIRHPDPPRRLTPTEYERYQEIFEEIRITTPYAYEVDGIAYSFDCPVYNTIISDEQTEASLPDVADLI